MPSNKEAGVGGRTMETRIPTSQEFEACCRSAFAYLVERGFEFETESEFSRRFSGPHFAVRVQGEGYGTVAAISFVDTSGREISSSRLIPRDQRGRPPEGQLEQIRFYAEQVRSHCEDLLDGDLERLRLAQAEQARTSRPAGGKQGG